LEPKFKNVRKRGVPLRKFPSSTSRVSVSGSSETAEEDPEPTPELSTGQSPESAEDVAIIKEALDAESSPEGSGTYCPECYLPLFPDPSPDKLYIYLHALRYTTSLGTFDTPLPPWAKEDYVVDQ
jgi:tRNA pseudouridine synthase 9